LFARFLAENHLLLHPTYRAPVTVAECEDLAADLGEPDGWSVAARFAAEILPGIFRLDDPCVRLRLAPEGRDALERIIAGLPSEVFAADDALGWVYQFWQKDTKHAINASERKIGGADLGPVTQLFTDNYMVRFLLENSLGAWWATRHPGSALVQGFEYLRCNEEGRPSSDAFEEWPDHVADVTVMDPCCGSGHFLVEAFSMLWQMRAEEEGLRPVEAQDAVLRDNLFGLELDQRCVQIAMFVVALHAWKVGGGWRQLPVPNVACSGIPVKASVDEWAKLAQVDVPLEKALVRLHDLFRDADTLGSLINPRAAAESTDSAGHQRSFEDVDWRQVVPLLEKAAERESSDPATAVVGAHAAGIARAAELLSGTYVLVATNVPYLSSVNQNPTLKSHLSKHFSDGRADLATAFILRSMSLGRSSAFVSPQNWLYLQAYRSFRKHLLTTVTLSAIARLGSGAFEGVTGEVVKPCLAVVSHSPPSAVTNFLALDAGDRSSAHEKAALLATGPAQSLPQKAQQRNPDFRIVLSTVERGTLLEEFASAYWGLGTGDDVRFVRRFWELPRIGDGWIRHQGTVARTTLYGGREHILLWEDGHGALVEEPGAFIRGVDIWGFTGVAVSQTGDLPATLYTGEAWNQNCAPIIPRNPEHLAAIWAYCASPEFQGEVRKIDQSLKVTNATLVKVPFDLERWQRVAEETGPLPEPSSDDPTQWLFEGRPDQSTASLHVAVGRLLGYRWPGVTTRAAHECAGTRGLAK